MVKAVKVAGVGAGYFSQFHYDSWARMPGAQVAGICDMDEGLARELAQVTGASVWSDLGAMLASIQPDLLDVIVPPVAQGEVIRTALAAGVRTIICQKPFCQSIEEAEAITAEAETAGAILVIHENFRFQPWYRTIAQAIGEGRIGQVQQATFRLRPGDGQGPRAYLDRQPYFQQMERFLVRETAVHWIDTFRFLFGNPGAVYADLRQLNPAIAGEDAGVILFDHTGGVRAVFDGNRHLDHAAENLRCTMGEALVEGTGGALRLTGDGAVFLRDFGGVDETRLLEADTSGTFGGDCVHALQSHVLAHLREGAPLENTARDYLAVARIEAAVYRSAREGRKLALDQRPIQPPSTTRTSPFT